MKKQVSKCTNCNEETSHSVKKVFSSKRMKLRRTVDKCNLCGSTTIKNNKKKNTYTKKLGGKNDKR